MPKYSIVGTPCLGGRWSTIVLVDNEKKKQQQVLITTDRDQYERVFASLRDLLSALGATFNEVTQ